MAKNANTVLRHSSSRRRKGRVTLDELAAIADRYWDDLERLAACKMSDEAHAFALFAGLAIFSRRAPGVAQPFIVAAALLTETEARRWPITRQ